MKKLLSVILSVLMLVSLAACGSEETADPEERVFRVGVVQLLQHEALDKATEGFKKALVDLLGDKVEFDDQNCSGDAATCNMIANQFVSDDVDLIFANATPALQSAVTATNSIPVVGTSISSFMVALGMDSWDGTTGKNVTGTSDLAPLDQQAKQVLEIKPDAKKVGILFCSAEPNSVFQADEIAKEFDKLGLQHEFFTYADSNDLASVTQTACDNSDVIYVPTDNVAASYGGTINNVVINAGIPVVTGEAGICLACGCVTISIDYFDIGYRAGEMAVDILVNGKDPATMPVETAPEYKKMFNKANCDIFGITLSDDYVEIQ